MTAPQTKHRRTTDAASDEGLRKGQRTRLRIKQGLSAALQTKGFHDVAVADICHHAEITIGGFYFHFENKEEALWELMEEFIAEMNSSVEATIDNDDARQCISNICYAFVEIYQSRHGLMRCLVQFMQVKPDLARKHREASRDWTSKLARIMTRNKNGLGKSNALFLSHAMAELIHRTLTMLYIFKDKRAIRSLGGLEQAPQALIAMCQRVFAADDGSVA